MGGKACVERLAVYLWAVGGYDSPPTACPAVHQRKVTDRDPPHIVIWVNDKGAGPYLLEVPANHQGMLLSAYRYPYSHNQKSFVVLNLNLYNNVQDLYHYTK